MPAPADTYGAAIYNTTGLVGYWRLGETSGTTAVDASASPHNGTYTGSYLQAQPGALGTTGDKALGLFSFLGYVSVPHNAVFNVTGDLTLEAWVFPTRAFVSTVDMVITKSTGAGSANETFDWFLSSGVPYLYQYTTAQIGVGATRAPPLNQWSHLVVTKSGTTVRHYLNGQINGSGTLAGTVSTNALAVLIGQRADLTAAYNFTGTLDEVAIYNVALSPATIANHYAVATTLTIPPNVIVEIAFVAEPLNPSPTWTNITTKVQQIGIRRGRDNELARYQAGTATIVVDNRLRWFDPTYDSGPYYPFVRPGRRIRIRAGSPNTYTLFDGFIEAWPQSWEAQRAARVHITATDAFKMLNLTRLPAAYETLVKSHAPSGFWRFSEASGATAADSSGNGYNWTYVGTPVYGAGTGVLSEPASKSVWFGYPTAYIHGGSNMTALSSFSLELWFITGSVPASSFGQMVGRDVDGQAGHICLFMSNTGYIHFTITTSLIHGGVYYVDSAPGYYNSAWHHVVGTWDGGTMRLYIDGALIGSTATAGTMEAADNSWHMGVQYGGPWPWYGYADELVLYENQVLTLEQVKAHYISGQGFPSQTSAARVGAVLDFIGWPAAERVINGGTQTMQASTPNGASALDHLQTVSDTEAGRLFVNAAGKIRFDGRDTFFLPPYTSTLATFGDNPFDTTEHKYVDLVVSYDDTQIWNDVRLTRTGGVEQVANDMTSQTLYGQRTLSKSGLLHTTDASVLSQAQYLRNQYKDPHLRIMRLAIRPGVRTELWQQVLARDIGDRVRVGRRPQGLPPAIAQDSWIEGVEHDIAPGAWETRWTLSPADIATVWILGDATAGLLGTTTILSF